MTQSTLVSPTLLLLIIAVTETELHSQNRFRLALSFYKDRIYVLNLYLNPRKFQMQLQYCLIKYQNLCRNDLYQGNNYHCWTNYFFDDNFLLSKDKTILRIGIWKRALLYETNQTKIRIIKTTSTQSKKNTI